MSEELKPCPFCGSKANGPHEINMYPFGFPPRTHWEIICQSFCTNKKAESSELVIKKWNTRVSADEDERERFVQGYEEIREIYAGMDGSIPETAPEAYQQRIIKQMYDVAIEAIKAE